MPLRRIWTLHKKKQYFPLLHFQMSQASVTVINWECAKGKPLLRFKQRNLLWCLNSFNALMEKHAAAAALSAFSSTPSGGIRFKPSQSFFPELISALKNLTPKSTLGLIFGHICGESFVWAQSVFPLRAQLWNIWFKWIVSVPLHSMPDAAVRKRPYLLTENHKVILPRSWWTAASLVSSGLSAGSFSHSDL